MIKVQLSWNCDTTASFSVYRSLATIDPLNLPVPLVTDLAEKTFTDDTVEEYTIYFYRVMSKVNDKEYLSDEVIASVTSQTLFIINENENYTPPNGLAVNFIMRD